MTNHNQTKRHDEGQTYVEKPIMTEPQKFSNDDLILVSDCMFTLHKAMKPHIDNSTIKKIILETVVAKKNEEIRRVLKQSIEFKAREEMLEELLARCAEYLVDLLEDELGRDILTGEPFTVKAILEELDQQPRESEFLDEAREIVKGLK